MFPKEVEITKNNYTKWFKNDYSWTPQFPNIRTKCSSHMKNKKYDGMNAATKKAQHDAADIARKKTYAQYGLKGDI